jgi:hypothetical protein
LLDHYFLLARELVHDEPRVLLSHLDHDDLLFRLIGRWKPHQVAHAEQRQHLVPHHHHLTPLHPPQLRGLEFHRLVHVRHRQRIQLVPNTRQQRAHDRQRQRQPHRNGRALLRHRANLDAAA